MTKPATPLPWRVRTIDESVGGIDACENTAVAQVQLNDVHLAAGQPKAQELRTQDARYIVHTANCHGDLVEALERLIAAVQDCNVTLDCLSGPTPLAEIVDAQKGCEVLMCATDALTKAKSQ